MHIPLEISESHDMISHVELIKGDKVIANEERGANRGASKDKPLINERIRAKEVRLIDENGNNHGVVPTSQALRMAEEAELDLVVISPNQAPPVAKILNYGKYKYELEKKAKEAKKKQRIVEVKEIKVRYKIDTHDYEVRLKNIRKFISQGNKVKIIVMLRGREMQHADLAIELANKFIADLAEDPITIEKKPMVEGRNVTAWLAPSSN
jgi:translation initiation factor IF-3